jgi:hypothetical protein
MSAGDNNVPEQNKMFQNKIKNILKQLILTAISAFYFVLEDCYL